MKKFLIVLLSLLFSVSLRAEGDILTLLNQQRFEGKIISLKDCTVKFKVNKEKYFIPTADIQSIQFADPTNPIYQDYLNRNDPDKCLIAKDDAKNYHGKGGLHMLMGVLFGPFAVIGAALSKPSPQKDAKALTSGHKEYFDDPEYLDCYRKKARGQNIASTAAGWAVWIGTALLVSSLIQLNSIR